MIVSPEIEAIELVVRRPPGLLADGLVLGAGQAYFADEVTLCAGEERRDRIAV